MEAGEQFPPIVVVSIPHGGLGTRGVRTFLGSQNKDVTIPPSGLRTQLARGVREIDKALPSHTVGLKLYGNTREYFVGDRY